MVVGLTITSPTESAGSFDRVAARLPDAALHRLRTVAQMRVAGAHLAPGIEDRDDGLSEELLPAQAHLLRALPVRKATHVVGREPTLAAQVLEFSAAGHLNNHLSGARMRSNPVPEREC